MKENWKPWKPSFSLKVFKSKDVRLIVCLFVLQCNLSSAVITGTTTEDCNVFFRHRNENISYDVCRLCVYTHLVCDSVERAVGSCGLFLKPETLEQVESRDIQSQLVS